MSALGLRLRSELRSRLGSWLALALVVGLAAGAIMAAAAGARRTDSAYPRFLEAQRAYDAVVFNYPDECCALFDAARVESLPQVAESARAMAWWPLNTLALAPRDSSGARINRAKILRGRAADPRRADEIVLSLTAAEELDLDVGDSIPLFEPQFQKRAAMAGIRNLRLRVVGVQVSPGELPPVIGTNRGFIHHTPAFYRAYRRTLVADQAPKNDTVIVRLRRGAADLPAFEAELERISGGKPIALFSQLENAANVRRSIHLQAVGLWLLALLLGMATVLVLAQSIVRQAVLESDEHSTLRALGMTPAQLFGLGLARALVVGVAGAALAVVLAVLLSPLTPIGLARTVELDPGIAADRTVLLVGAAATIAVVLGLAVVPAWRAAHPRTAVHTRSRPSRVARGLARWGLPLPAATGVRMALEPGSGRTAVPVRTTLAAAALGVAAAAAALTFAASLTHLLGTPRLYGHIWDIGITDYGYAKVDAEGRAILAADPDVGAFSIGGSGGTLLVNGRRLDGAGYDAVEGAVLPPRLSGRAPSRPDEIALGRRSLEAVGAVVGDVVVVRSLGGRRRARMRVVGEVVMPAYSDSARLGEGALLTFQGIRWLSPGVPASEAMVDLVPGADRGRVLARLQRQLSNGPAPALELPLTKPSDVVNFGRVQRLPFVLAAVLAALALLTLAHLLVTAIRRRRRDLAVLKTIGFTRFQVEATVAWQAITVAAAGLLIGVPVGVAAGRWAWRLFADEFGIAPEPVVPLALVLLLIPSTVLAACLIAILPARSAARTRPAFVLRAE